jgi:hypothetical protein
MVARAARAIYHCTTNDDDTIEIPITEILGRIFNETPAEIRVFIYGKRIR